MHACATMDHVHTYFNVLVTRTDVHIHALERNLEGTGCCSVPDNNINLTYYQVDDWYVACSRYRTFDYYTDI